MAEQSASHTSSSTTSNQQPGTGVCDKRSGICLLQSLRHRISGGLLFHNLWLPDVQIRATWLGFVCRGEDLPSTPTAAEVPAMYRLLGRKVGGSLNSEG